MYECEIHHRHINYLRRVGNPWLCHSSHPECHKRPWHLARPPAAAALAAICKCLWSHGEVSLLRSLFPGLENMGHNCRITVLGFGAFTLGFKVRSHFWNLVFQVLKVLGRTATKPCLGFKARHGALKVRVPLLKSRFPGLKSIGQNRNKTLFGFQGSSWRSEGEVPLLRSRFPGFESREQNRNKTLLGFQG
jgi:hypothetical protein